MFSQPLYELERASVAQLDDALQASRGSSAHSLDTSGRVVCGLRTQDVVLDKGDHVGPGNLFNKKQTTKAAGTVLAETKVAGLALPKSN